jgi:hypothetical protein
MNALFPMLMFTLINGILLSGIAYAKHKNKGYIAAWLISLTITHIIYFYFVMTNSFSSKFLPYFRGIIQLN